MRYWVYEIAGWLLLACGLYVFYLCYLMLDEGRFFEAGPLTLIGFFVFRGGLYLMKVGVAARVCSAAPEAPAAERAAAPPVPATRRTHRVPAGRTTP